MIFNEEFETLPREQLEILQLKRLKDLVERSYYRVKPYREKMDEAGVTPVAAFKYPGGLTVTCFNKLYNALAENGIETTVKGS